MIVLTLYTRPGCHLCDELLAELEPMVEDKARVEIVDISDDETLSRRFGLLIPVLMHGDEELARYPLDRDRIERLIGSAS